MEEDEEKLVDMILNKEISNEIMKHDYLDKQMILREHHRMGRPSYKEFRKELLEALNSDVLESIDERVKLLEIELGTVKNIGKQVFKDLVRED